MTDPCPRNELTEEEALENFRKIYAEKPCLSAESPAYQRRARLDASCFFSLEQMMRFLFAAWLSVTCSIINMKLSPIHGNSIVLRSSIEMSGTTLTGELTGDLAPLARR